MKTKTDPLLDVHWLLTQLSVDEPNVDQLIRKKNAELEPADRVTLLNYYIRSTDRRDEVQSVKLITWLIENYPESPLFKYLPQSRLRAWSNSSFANLKDSWTQVLKRKRTTTVLTNAALCISPNDIEWSIKLLEQFADQRNMKSLSWELVHLYESQAKGLQNESHRALQNAVKSAKAVLNLKSISNPELFGLLKHITPKALALGDQQSAKKFTDRLFELSKEPVQSWWKQYALIFQVQRKLLLGKDPGSALQLLEKAILKYPTHASASLEMIGLFKDLQYRSLTRPLLSLLELCISTTKSSHERKKRLLKWRREIQRNGFSTFT